MSIEDKIDDLIDGLTNLTEGSFDFDMSDVQVDYLSITNGRIVDVEYTGDPIIEDSDYVYADADELHSKLLELVKSVREEAPGMGDIYDAVAKVLGNKLVVEVVNRVPTPMDTAAIARELTIVIKGE